MILNKLLLLLGQFLDSVSWVPDLMAGASRHSNDCSPPTAHELVYVLDYIPQSAVRSGGSNPVLPKTGKKHQSRRFQAAQQMFTQLLTPFLSSHSSAKVWGNKQWTQQARQKDSGRQGFHTTLGESGKFTGPALDAAQLMPSREKQVLQTRKIDKGGLWKRGTDKWNASL